MAVRLVLVLIALGALTGCEQLPWSSRNRVDASGPTTPEAAIMPVRPPVPADQIIADVNGAAISKTDVELRLQELKILVANAGQTWTPLSQDQLKGVAEELVNTELMAQDMTARGRDRSLEVQQRWEYLRRGFFAQEWLRWQQEQLSVTGEEVQAYYDQNKMGFREPERRKLRQLVVASEDQASRALAQLHGGATTFEELAQQISVAPTASAGGLLAPWVMRADDKQFAFGSEQEAQDSGVVSLDPALEKIAFAIDQVDHVSSYALGADGRYHIFQLVEQGEARERPITDVWDDIKSFLLAQKLQQALEGLKQPAKIQWFTERLDSVTP